MEEEEEEEEEDRGDGGEGEGGAGEACSLAHSIARPSALPSSPRIHAMHACLVCGSRTDWGDRRCSGYAWRKDYYTKRFVAFSTKPNFPLIDPLNRPCGAFLLSAPGAAFALNQCGKPAITGAQPVSRMLLPGTESNQGKALSALHGASRRNRTIQSINPLSPLLTCAPS